jgi:hypothetical protein
LTEQVLQGHLPILAGNVYPHEARTAWRPLLADNRGSAIETQPSDRADPPHRVRARALCSIYRGQSAATELTTAQIAAHNPTDNSVITVSDATLLS